jgi:hypothetical protein
MVAPARGLSPADLGAVREALSLGRRPRVVFTASAGQIAGQSGQVVGLDDPASSDEWIVVRFGKDELPFAAQDLAMPVRGARSPKPDAQPAVVPAPGPAKVGPARAQASAQATDPGPAPAGPMSAVTAGSPDGIAPSAAAPARKAPAAPTAAAPAQTQASANGAATGPAPAGPSGAATRDGGASSAAGPARAQANARSRLPAPLVVTLSYADREWTVAATQGSRAIAKPQPIRPTDALRMVSLVDAPGLHDAVENIIAAERAEAEHRAQRLRAELAEIESRLSELVSRG